MTTTFFKKIKTSFVEKVESFHILGEAQNGTTVENNIKDSRKIRAETTIESSNLAPGDLTKSTEIRMSLKDVNNHPSDTTTLFTTAKMVREPKWPSAGKQTKIMCFLCVCTCVSMHAHAQTQNRIIIPPLKRRKDTCRAVEVENIFLAIIMWQWFLPSFLWVKNANYQTWSYLCLCTTTSEKCTELS